MNDLRSEIGQCVRVLCLRRWDKTDKPRAWWKARLRQLCSESHDASEILNPRTAQPAPMPYEIEFPFEQTSRERITT